MEMNKAYYPRMHDYGNSQDHEFLKAYHPQEDVLQVLQVFDYLEEHSPGPLR